MIYFNKKYKNVRFDIDNEPKKNIDKYDFVITDKIKYDESHLRHVIFKDDIVLAASKAHPLAKKGKIKIGDFKDEPLITYDDDSGLYSLTKQICREEDFNPKVKI